MKKEVHVHAVVVAVEEVGKKKENWEKMKKVVLIEVVVAEVVVKKK